MLMATPGTESSTTQEQNRSGSTSSASSPASDRREAASTTGLGDEIRQIVRDKTYEQIGTQKQRATDNLGSLAGAVRSMTQPLRDSGQSGLASYVNRAADGIERWSSSLRDRDPEDALRELQQFARRNPAVFLGAAFGVGVLAARFLKSSAEDRSGVGYGSMRSSRSASGTSPYGTSGYGSTGYGSSGYGSTGSPSTGPFGGGSR
jgi:hypothetical protein